MSKWKQTTLGKVLSSGGGKIQTGPFGSQLHASDYVETGIPCIMPANMKNNRVDLSGIAFIAEKDAKRLSHHLVQAGDIVYSRRGDVTQKALIREAEAGYFCGTGCLLVRPGDAIDPEFLTYHLSTPTNQDWIVKQAVGATMPNLNTAILSAVPLNVPPNKETQKKVAAVLSALDAKIDCNNRINAELEAKAKTLYDYWFVQFEFPDDRGKPYKSSGGTMVFNVTLKRKIPEGWIVGPLSDWIASDKTGDWGKEAAEGNYILDVDCIRGTDIRGLNGTGTVAPPKRFILEKNKGKILSPFDFVIEISGGSPTQSTGRLALITSETIKRFSRPLICSNFCKAITLKNNSYFFNFAYLWKSAYENKVLFGWEGKTSGIKNLLFDAFTGKYIVCMPPQKIAQSFFDFVSPLETKKQALLRENDELERLREWLLPLLMTGQVTMAPV